ncbi:hypothetical protein ACB092_07G137100 [Castanea dentata]
MENTMCEVLIRIIACWWRMIVGICQVLLLRMFHTYFGRNFGKFRLLTRFAISFGVLSRTRFLRSKICMRGIFLWTLPVTAVEIIWSQFCTVYGYVMRHGSYGGLTLVFCSCSGSNVALFLS